jgi:hypothetical protein
VTVVGRADAVPAGAVGAVREQSHAQHAERAAHGDDVDRLVIIASDGDSLGVAIFQHHIHDAVRKHEAGRFRRRGQRSQALPPAADAPGSSSFASQTVLIDRAYTSHIRSG